MGRQLRDLLVLGIVFLLLFLLEPAKLLAQQTQLGDQGWSQNDPDAQRSYPDSVRAYPERGYGQASTSAQPLSAVQLEQLVAPIALYPDTLVAQVLAASTYPGQVADADRWLQTQGYISSDQIAAGADVQNWDPSVKALTAFPRVLAQMDRNLQWTTDLGNAYYNQPLDVFEAVQVMRRRAQAAGTLQSTPQQVVHYNQDYIQLMPVNSQVVYVPTYNPWTVYGEQVSPYPGFSLLGAVESFLGSSPINYGFGIVMSAFSQTPWGWLAWGLNWLAQSVLFNQSDYYSHSTTVSDWGFRHDAFHAYAGRAAFARHNYDRGPGGYHRFGGYDRNRGQGFSGFSRARERYSESWRGNYNHGFHAFGASYERTPRQADNHMRVQESRQQFDRRGIASSLNRWSGEGYRGGAGAASYHSMQAVRGPTSGFQREFGGRSSGAFASRGFAGSAAKPSHSGGFHLGGGHVPKDVSSRGSAGFHMGGGHAPKSFHGGGKNFGGGHSHGGGGHSGGHGGGKHHR